MSITLQLPMTFRSKRRAALVPATDQSSEIAEFGQALATPGQISASPWEGLYVEPGDESAEPVDHDRRLNLEVERFLATLMYGE